jgi:5'-nucleotidase
VLHRKPDLLVSGINHGSNSSINVLYSGTMSAAMEGAIEGMPSVGFSLCNYSYDADFSLAKSVAQRVAKNIIQDGLPQGTLLNVNIPNVVAADFKGLKVCRQAIAKWQEEFDERRDPNGRRYFWLTGKFINMDKGIDTDEWALANNFASIVPVHFDLTAYHAMQALNSWELSI